jgi:hypothetical protein
MTDSDTAACYGLIGNMMMMMIQQHIIIIMLPIKP